MCNDLSAQELVDIEDETWWLVRRCSPAGREAKDVHEELQPAHQGAMVPPPRKLNQGWVPEEYVRVLARRPEGTSMIAGTSDWRNTLAHEARAAVCGATDAAAAVAVEGLAAAADDDREVAKLIAYKEIMATRKHATPLFLADEWLDHPLAHCLAAVLVLAHGAAIVTARPNAFELVFGLVTGFIAVDLLSTIYHLCLDYALLSSNTVTVTDLHHKLPLNYNLFGPRQLVATSYVAVLPMHALHLLLHGVCELSRVGNHPAFLVHSGVAAVLGCSCGFVHNAAHRRRHDLPIASGMRLLQDMGILLHPDVHSQHHREAHDKNFSLFSGITHPFTDRLLKLAWQQGWLPPTPESHRVKLS